MKRTLTLSLVIMALVSPSGLAAAKPSLLPFNPDWTAVEIQDLIDAGADVNARPQDGWTVLMLAAAYHTNPEVVAKLIAAGAEVDARDEEGFTPLMFAAQSNENPEVIKALIAAGAEVDARTPNGDSAVLRAAAHNANPEVIKALFEARAHVDTRDSYGATALMVASVLNANPEVVAELIEAGADVNARGKNNTTALMIAAEESQALRVIRALIAGGSEVDARNSYGQTALMRAAKFNTNPEIVAELIVAGAEVDERDNDGKTALMMAAATNENPEFIKILIAAGADINAMDDVWGQTALMQAALMNPNPEIVRVLLDAGADKHLKSYSGSTAFDKAKMNKHIWGTPEYCRLSDSILAILSGKWPWEHVSIRPDWLSENMYPLVLSLYAKDRSVDFPAFEARFVHQYLKSGYGSSQFSACQYYIAKSLIFCDMGVLPDGVDEWMNNYSNLGYRGYYYAGPKALLLAEMALVFAREPRFLAMFSEFCAHVAPDGIARFDHQVVSITSAMCATFSVLGEDADIYLAYYDVFGIIEIQRTAAKMSQEKLKIKKA